MMVSLIIGFCTFTNAQTGIYVPSMNSCDSLINNFLIKYNIQEATVAIAKDGKLIYMRGLKSPAFISSIP